MAEEEQVRGRQKDRIKKKKRQAWGVRHRKRERQGNEETETVGYYRQLKERARRKEGRVKKGVERQGMQGVRQRRQQEWGQGRIEAEGRVWDGGKEEEEEQEDPRQGQMERGGREEG